MRRLRPTAGSAGDLVVFLLYIHGQHPPIHQAGQGSADHPFLTTCEPGHFVGIERLRVQTVGPVELATRNQESGRRCQGDQVGGSEFHAVDGLPDRRSDRQVQQIPPCRRRHDQTVPRQGGSAQEKRDRP